MQSICNTITYDYFRNKPITITGTAGTITYTYNGKGELISRSKTQNETTITNTYFWDENGYMINEGDGTSITHGNLVGLNGIFARFDGAGAIYYGKNAHGDVIYTQNNLTITKHYDYDPFGNETNPDPNDSNPFRYCGEYFDVHSGTYYLRNRYYYPRLGRFTTIDPIRSGHNWYVYCGNNPLMFVDPFGLAWTESDERVYQKMCAMGNEASAMKFKTAIENSTQRYLAAEGDRGEMTLAHLEAVSIRRSMYNAVGQTILQGPTYKYQGGINLCQIDILGSRRVDVNEKDTTLFSYYTFYHYCWYFSVNYEFPIQSSMSFR